MGQLPGATRPLAAACVLQSATGNTEAAVDIYILCTFVIFAASALGDALRFGGELSNNYHW